ncbi:MAG TPA: NAD-dependent epimerase/dehydratase family protein [Vicinamibacteria bacterium]|nr:NAD-dependent epimerase/dehydratase family protein [Vicinamibacteria bacterium]
MGRIALTGAASFLGGRLLRRLVETRDPDGIVVLDVADPPPALGVRHRALDFTQPAADASLLAALREEEAETLVHFAFLTNPRRDQVFAHELESIGTLSLFAAAAAAGVRRVVVRSFTAVYGARGQNPSFLDEDRPLLPNASVGWVRDKLEAEQHAASFARRYPEMAIAVLRFAPLLGPQVRTFYTRILDKRVVPMLMGFDPLLQMLHPDDALEAAVLALAREVRGAFNVVPRAPMPLGAALHLAAKVPLPVPHPLAYILSEALWAAGVSEAPAGLLDYVRYPWVADGARAERELGFRARHSSREALLAYLRYRHPEAAEAGVREATA